jgi:hypothetical protein
MKGSEEHKAMKRAISSFCRLSLALLAMALIVGFTACTSAPLPTTTPTPTPIPTPIPTGETYSPIIDPADFVAKIDNQYFTLTPGTTFIYQGTTGEGNERNEVYVSHQTKKILGVTCIEVRDRVTIDNELAEETFDWYAQDKDGNVWYLGEAATEYEKGVVVGTEGSWEAGVDGAEPGIIMQAKPKIGDSYRQEYYKGVAEDMAEVLSINESATVPYGSFQNCLKTKDFSALEPSVVENKYYAPGVGMVLGIMVKGGSERLELVEIKTE